jgi:hypothetical protein
MLTEYVDAATLSAVVIVNVDVALLKEGVTEGGLKLQVTPLTKPEQERLTALLNPLSGAIVTVDVEDAPAVIVPGENGVAEIWKSNPVPTRSTACGLLDALSVIASCAARMPAAVGANVALATQLAPAASEAPQVLV